MTPAQREAALRLADWLHASGVVNSEVKETIALLRELAAEPQGEPINGRECCNRKAGSPTEVDLSPPAHPPQQRRPPREQITAAAKALCRQASTACNVDFDDNWKVYGDNYIADATAALNAAYGIGEAP